LFGPGVALDAFEVHDGNPAGDQFQIIRGPEEDPMALLARLVEKIRRLYQQTSQARRSGIAGRRSGDASQNRMG
jgi:hypothetical protein